MNLKDYLKKVAYIAGSTIPGDHKARIYYSKYDQSYITRVGMGSTEGLLKFISDHEITDLLTHGVGFSPKEGKWYGWSHRAIYGFKIGSICKKGDVHYRGSTIQEQQEAAILFWEDKDHVNTRCEGIVAEEDGKKFFDIKWEYSDKIPNREMRNTTQGAHYAIGQLGKGEWEAKTLEDAKQMAIDFNKGVL